MVGGILRVMVLLGCPEPPVLIPSCISLINMLKEKGCEVVISANPAALKLIESADPEKYYLKNVGAQSIDNGLKSNFPVDLIIGMAHNDAAVNYIITYKSVYGAKTVAMVFGKTINNELIEDLMEEEIPCQSAKAFHNPTPVIVKLKKIVEEYV